MRTMMAIGGVVGLMGVISLRSGPRAEASVATSNHAVVSTSIGVSSSISSGVINVSIAPDSNSTCTSQTNGWCCQTSASSATVSFGAGFNYARATTNAPSITSWTVTPGSIPQTINFGVVGWDAINSKLVWKPDPFITVQTGSC